ncbi:hypothetical protein Purlil1_14114 [Purpureocillium lilacinum]|uniref:Uncharacterized protein n=1 Tax=Purpureocillium lilacinum TaxID=33203 RepID=A0ABR0BC85_PURLI|nr:hypothetical protein Purlil1_14114 [Purpureocillium lilacinum]
MPFWPEERVADLALRRRRLAIAVNIDPSEEIGARIVAKILRDWATPYLWGGFCRNTARGTLLVQSHRGAAVIQSSSVVTSGTLDLFIPPPVENLRAAQRLVDAMALPPTAVSHLAFSGRDRLAIDAGIPHRKRSPTSRPRRIPRVGTPRVSRRRHEVHSHASSTSPVAGVDDAFPERRSCGGVDELRDTSMASLQRIETHEYGGTDAQTRRIMLCLFACGRRRIPESAIARTRKGRGAVGTYWHMQESKPGKGQGTRQLSGRLDTTARTCVPGPVTFGRPLRPSARRRRTKRA